MSVEEQRLALRRILAESGAWLESIRGSVLPDAGATFDYERLDEDIGRIIDLHNRATSSMLTVAFTGEMSSGKSFLVNALHGQLRYEVVLNEQNLPTDKFVGLLPSYTEQTSSCPVSVEPVVAQAESTPPITLKVRFADSEEWTWIADDPSARTVAAYLTDLPDRVGYRHEHHAGKLVAEAQLLVPAADLPAVLYDLPGLNAPGRHSDLATRKAWNRADCLVYVTSATHTLLDTELELIAELYKHYQANGGRKRMIWVVTAIDTAMDLSDDNVARWKRTVRRNTQYIRDFIRSTGDDNPDFVGIGFLGVSPALEARSRFRGARTAHGSAETDAANSRMDELRSTLHEVIDAGAGAQHLSAVASAALKVIRPTERILGDVLASVRTPHDLLQSEITSLERLIQQRATMPQELRREFGGRLTSDIDRLIATFRARHGLARHLHEQLDSHIAEADLLSPRVAGELDIRTANAVRKWIWAEDGPYAQWTTIVERLADNLRARNHELALQSAENPFSYAVLDPDTYESAPRTRVSTGHAELTDKAAAVMTAVFPIAGAATATAGTLTATGVAGQVAGAATIAGMAATTALGLALAPIGVTMAVTGFYVWRRRTQQRRTSREAMRAEFIEYLDIEARDAAAWFQENTQSIGTALIEQAAERIDAKINELRLMVARRRERLNAPAVRAERQYIDTLVRMCQQGDHLVTSLEQVPHN
jgi:hypothetical protein